jgi:predicted nuclease of restriction endonuclease-like (RecB) superfamily
MNLSDPEYKTWLTDLKAKIRSVQLKAAIAVNSALIKFYWELGKMIEEKETGWGSLFLDTLSHELKLEFPDMKGFSKSNLKYCKRFYEFYQSSIGQQPVDQLMIQSITQIPWGHNILIFTKSKDIKEANFYLQQTLENSWSRDVLALQIKSRLYERQGKAITNFKHTLPAPQSELAEQTLKDPYIFDFLAMSGPYKERDIENQLVSHIMKFLLELGKGFAFLGQQYHLEVAGND